MLPGLWVSEALSQTKVNHVDVVLLLANTNQEVVWLDIPVKEMARVNKLYSLKLYRHISIATRIKDKLV